MLKLALIQPYLAMTPTNFAVFGLTMFEIGVIFFLTIYYLAQPSDKKRLWFLILLILIVLNNFCSIFFPDDSLGISMRVQDAVPFFLKFIMSFYLGYYLYRAFDLKDVRLFLNYGSVLFLILPYTLLILFPVFKTNLLFSSSDFTNSIPFVYSIGFVYNSTIILKNRTYVTGENEHENSQVIFSAYVVLLCWSLLPLLSLFGNFEVHMLLVTNGSFLVMSIYYVRAAVINMQRGSQALQLSKQSLLKEVEERTRELKEMYEERTNIFINLAHEMRTPLTFITNHVELMARNYGSITGMEALRFNIQRLSNDITNFFDSERYSKGFTVYDHSQVSDFSELLKYKIDIIKSSSIKKEFEIEDDVATALLVKAHPGAIDRIINNLLENAIKYSPKNEKIIISLSLEEGKICFSVSNRGTVIPSDQLEKVFEPYFQLATKNNDGVGIGLSIVKKIVEDIGGRIKIDSGESNIQVAVTLPAYQGEEAVTTIQTDTPIQLPTKWIIKDITGQVGKPNILLIEDDLELAHFLPKYFSDLYNMYVATSGEQGLAKVGVIENLDLIISDVMMKGMSGFEFCETILNNESYEHIPFIFFTAKATAEAKRAGLNLGAIDYIEKPFSFDALALKINSVLAMLQKRQEKIEASVKSSVGPHRPTGPVFDANCKMYGITKREKEVIQLVIVGKSNKEVANTLFISEFTVGKHKSNIYKKLGFLEDSDPSTKANSTVANLILKLCFDQQ